VVERNDWHNNDALQQSLNLFEWVKRLPSSLPTEIETSEAVVQALLVSVIDPKRGHYTVRQLLAFAALIHDVGKAQTFQHLPNGKTHCPRHEAVSARLAGNICARFDFTPLEARFITNLVGVHGEPYALFKEAITLPAPQQQEQISYFQANHADHLVPLLLLACGDLLTGHLQGNQPQKYIAILHFYQRRFRSIFRSEQDDSQTKNDQ